MCVPTCVLICACVSVCLWKFLSVRAFVFVDSIALRKLQKHTKKKKHTEANFFFILFGYTDGMNQLNSVF